MANHSDSVSRTGPDGGLLGVSARWLASQSKLLASGFINNREQERTLESLDALSVGLEVWDNQGRRLFSNRTNANLLDGGFPTTDAMRLIDVAQSDNGAWLPLSSAAGPHENGGTARRDPLVQSGAASPHLQELPGNRWVSVYGACSATGYVAVARVDVTDIVRRGQELEDRVRQLMRESTTDGLTGLANRRHFDATLAIEWNRAARSQTFISLLMVDIDHFKKYNDHYGHQAGDRCLQQVALALESCVRRAGELVARYGGEEFVLLLPGSDVEEARETAQKCLDKMRDAALPHAASPCAQEVTLSIGVASIQPQPSSESVSMLNAADCAMYRAKAGGRARYAIANQDDWEMPDDTPRTQPGPL
ncbi:MAG: diguanylate cyclase [Pseudomonadota bacterium]